MSAARALGRLDLFLVGPEHFDYSLRENNSVDKMLQVWSMENLVADACVASSRATGGPSRRGSPGTSRVVRLGVVAVGGAEDVARSRKTRPWHAVDHEVEGGRSSRSAPVSGISLVRHPGTIP